MLLPILIAMLCLQVAQQVFDLVLALHRGEALFEIRFTEIRACLGDEECLLRVTFGGGLVDAAAHPRYGA